MNLLNTLFIIVLTAITALPAHAGPGPATGKLPGSLSAVQHE